MVFSPPAAAVKERRSWDANLKRGFPGRLIRYRRSIRRDRQEVKSRSLSLVSALKCR
jgi:hypothetical protein